MPIVPFKLNQDRRHHIPRQRRTVTNWPAYDASLRQRGSPQRSPSSAWVDRYLLVISGTISAGLD
jgi:hypothetical protein